MELYTRAADLGNRKAHHNLAIEGNSGSRKQVWRHFKIAASAGSYHVMNAMQKLFDRGVVSIELIDSTLQAYNNSCAEMRSEARDDCIRFELDD